MDAFLTIRLLRSIELWVASRGSNKRRLDGMAQAKELSTNLVPNNQSDRDLQGLFTGPGGELDAGLLEAS